jgi:hypothetical protein
MECYCGRFSPGSSVSPANSRHTDCSTSNNHPIERRNTVLPLAKLKKKLNSVACVREWTIPTERQPLVSEVSANVCGLEGATWSACRISTAVSRFSRPDPLLLLSSSSSIVLTRLSGPRSRPTTSQKIGSAGNRTWGGGGDHTTKLLNSAHCLHYGISCRFEGLLFCSALSDERTRL